ncbi:MAG: hypothetical protein ACOYJI_02665 [Anaerovoracaceae bacterium]
MLRYKLESYENGCRIYIYYPEGEMNAPGKVALYDDGTVIILEPSESDVKNIYAHHALSGIDKEKATGTVAWY